VRIWLNEKEEPCQIQLEDQEINTVNVRPLE
jgi:hypothetical protein